MRKISGQYTSYMAFQTCTSAQLQPFDLGGGKSSHIKSVSP